MMRHFKGRGKTFGAGRRLSHWYRECHSRFETSVRSRSARMPFGADGETAPALVEPL